MSDADGCSSGGDNGMGGRGWDGLSTLAMNVSWVGEMEVGAIVARRIWRQG